MSGIASFYSQVVHQIDEVLDCLLPAAEVDPTRLHEAMRWSVFAGGKRFRPALTIAVGRAFGVDDSRLLTTAAAIEMIHAFSLIHDDLPAMDDDNLRRGKETCHIKFDESTAILAGDALHALAFKAIAEDEKLPVVTRLQLIVGLATATGTPSGMVAGQQFDLEAEGRDHEADIVQIHSLKTGALINFSARAGALIAAADESKVGVINEFADQLGLLFQITDDLLDMSQTSDVLGKTAGKDAAAAKATYPGKYGFDTASQMAIDVHRCAVASLEPLGDRARLLTDIAGNILNRTS